MGQFPISSVDSPDITHVVQMTFILRYVSPEGCIEERFVKFLPIASHSGEALFNCTLLHNVSRCCIEAAIWAKCELDSTCDQTCS
ncbi:hypothetical protein F2P81_018455 [Scophthalmus maximus]|uniref:Uncharacterized protein n=1 Tax=Scophthalmus maximus TaxID=52904 RepID=A0A6A4SC83_SCOMX|nr:hypothetical protein F2P81_018455 [Scophthalmus maximus]